MVSPQWFLFTALSFLDFSLLWHGWFTGCREISALVWSSSSFSSSSSHLVASSSSHSLCFSPLSLRHFQTFLKNAFPETQRPWQQGSAVSCALEPSGKCHVQPRATFQRSHPAALTSTWAPAVLGSTVNH